MHCVYLRCDFITPISLKTFVTSLSTFTFANWRSTSSHFPVSQHVNNTNCWPVELHETCVCASRTWYSLHPKWSKSKYCFILLYLNTHIQCVKRTVFMLDFQCMCFTKHESWLSQKQETSIIKNNKRRIQNQLIMQISYEMKMDHRFAKCRGKFIFYISANHHDFFFVNLDHLVTKPSIYVGRHE